MSELVIASSQADASAVEAVAQHHAVLAGALRQQAEALFAATSRGDTTVAETARHDLVEWCERELLPHALAEERAMYPAAQALVEGRLLVDAMLDEHGVIAGLLREVADSPDLSRATAFAVALRVVFDSHLTKENDLVLPLLAAAPGVSVAGLLEGMHQLLGGDESHSGSREEDAPCGGHTCTCGEADSPGYPELDVRSIPHAIRHATILGALESVQTGAGLELVAPHDPLPLLAQVDQRWPGAFAVTYSERGPEAWRLSMARTDM